MTDPIDMASGVLSESALPLFEAVSRRTNPTTKDRLHVSNSEPLDLHQFCSRRQ